MVRPRKIPKDFIPEDWSDTEEEHEEEEYEENEEEGNIAAAPQAAMSEEEELETDSDTDTDGQDYAEMGTGLEDLAKEWLLIEVNHSVSKRGSDLFWNLAKKMFHSVVEQQSKTTKKVKIPAFTHLRRQLLARYCPKVRLDLAYKNTKTDEIITQHDVSKISVAQHRKPTFEPLYEIATVQVRKVQTQWN